MSNPNMNTNQTETGEGNAPRVQPNGNTWLKDIGGRMSLYMTPTGKIVVGDEPTVAPSAPFDIAEICRLAGCREKA